MNRLIPIVAVAFAVVAGGAWWMSSKPAPETGVQMTQADTTQTDAPSNIDTSDIVEMTIGPADAKVTIVEYASFTCPHCATFHKGTLKQMKADFVDTGKVHFIYRDVFFDRFGLWASMVARCGGRDKFFGISDLIYEQQSDWIGDGDPVQIADNLRKLGKVAGLDNAALEACLADDAKAKTLVAWFQGHAEADNINSTPTLMINGKQHSNMPYSELKPLIEGLLGE